VRSLGRTPRRQVSDAWTERNEKDTNFKNPQIEAMLLRAIAWAGHYSVDSLVNAAAPVRTGGRGRGGRVAQMRPLRRAVDAGESNGKHDADPPEQPVRDGKRGK
jgi:hypothetical protein